jgi:phosphoserine phosphatase
MRLVATLVSARAVRAVDAATIERAAATLPADEVVWLEPQVAVDLILPADAADPADIKAQLRDILGDAPVDIIVQPVEGRRKRLLIADMDSTVIGQECIDELAAEVGLKEHVAAITERAMRGEIAFEPALRERVALLTGLTEGIATKVIAERITLNSGAVTLIRTMRANGGYTALVSGGFTMFTKPIAAMIGFDETHANILVIADGKLDGTVADPILGQDAKRRHLMRLTAEKGLSGSETIAVGDGANDLAMIEAAGIGVAYHAKPAVAARASAVVDHADLTALLFMQGYKATEFVEG